MNPIVRINFRLGLTPLEVEWRADQTVRFFRRER
jgi:hypothetical protein